MKTVTIKIKNILNEVFYLKGYIKNEDEGKQRLRFYENEEDILNDEFYFISKEEIIFN